MTEQIQSDILNALPLPGFEQTLGDLGLVKNLVVQEDSSCKIEIELPVPGYPHQNQLSDSIREKLASTDNPPKEVSIDYSLNVRGPESGGAIGLRVKNVIAVGSGKGGVGKSTIAASLAYGLKSMGAKVGLLDADVYGPSIPHLLGATGKPEVHEHLNPDGSVIQRIHPVQCQGIAVMSIAFLVPEENAVIWRGPMLHKLLTQFISETEWGELDYLIVDMPPGTGDVALTLSQMMSLAGAVVVCTPQKVALLDAVKAIAMYRQVKIPILGMVENMTGELFGSGGAKQTAIDKKIPFLGEVPSDVTIRIRGDESKLGQLFEEDSAARESLEKVCVNVAMEIAQQFLVKPQAPTLEILQ
ncbi:MAG: Mrp/NBP35 family ATP-binding protein [Planctomycetaceae bacterium]|nr:Mrp/NBP35 family ATP-binding protein [Planctomycetaceae bacterium]